MPRASHAAERAPQQADEPKATLSQLGELVAQMEKGKIGRYYLQAFLRKELVRESQAVLVPREGNALLARIEEVARRYYPHAVNEILKIAAPWCDPHLDLELRPMRSEKVLSEQIRNAMGRWFSPQQLYLCRLSKSYIECGMPGGEILQGESFGNRSARIYSDVFKTHEHLNPALFNQITKLVYGEGEMREKENLADHLEKRIDETGAVKYGIISRHRSEGSGIFGSIIFALMKAMQFAVVDDRERLEHMLRFLDFQRSGNPVFHWNAGNTYVLGLD